MVGRELPNSRPHGEDHRGAGGGQGENTRMRTAGTGKTEKGLSKK